MRRSSWPLSRARSAAASRLACGEPLVANGPPTSEKTANIRNTENRNSAIGETNLARSPAM